MTFQCVSVFIIEEFIQIVPRDLINIVLAWNNRAVTGKQNYIKFLSTFFYLTTIYVYYYL